MAQVGPLGGNLSRLLDRTRSAQPHRTHEKVARMLRVHEELILNWFRAKGEISAGTVEGLNNKIRVMTRRSYGFRTYEAMEIALYHTLGRLPEPESTHRFC
jgi:transposase